MPEAFVHIVAQRSTEAGQKSGSLPAVPLDKGVRGIPVLPHNETKQLWILRYRLNSGHDDLAVSVGNLPRLTNALGSTLHSLLCDFQQIDTSRLH